MATLSAKFSSVKQTGFLSSGAGRLVAGAALAALLAAPVGLVAAGYGDDPDAQVSAERVTPQVSSQVNSQIRAVRLSSVEGSVTIQRGGETQFSQAYPNMPLIEGSQIETSESGRAELEFEDGSVVRLTPNSTLSMTSLESDANGVLTSEIELQRGLAYFELRHSERMPFTVGFMGRVAQPVTNTTFRINLDANPIELAVLSGRTQVRQEEQGADALYAVNVKKSETIRFDESDGSRYFLTEGVSSESWDEWNADRDKVAMNMALHQTTAANSYGSGGYGWSDLDYYGNWYPVPGYGLMWQPGGAYGGGFAGAGFDPYGCGYWAYYPGFGQTWVSCYAWGWAPFHGGSWSYVNGFGWGWVPGGGTFLPVTPVRGGPTGYKPPRKPNGGLNTGGVTRGGLVAANRGLVAVGAAKGTSAGVANLQKALPRAVVVNGQNIEPLKPVTLRTTQMDNPALSRDAPVSLRNETVRSGAIVSGEALNPSRTTVPSVYRGSSVAPAGVSGAQLAVGQRLGLGASQDFGRQGGRQSLGSGNSQQTGGVMGQGVRSAVSGGAGGTPPSISRSPSAGYSGGVRSGGGSIGGSSMGSASSGARMSSGVSSSGVSASSSASHSSGSGSQSGGSHH